MRRPIPHLDDEGPAPARSVAAALPRRAWALGLLAPATLFLAACGSSSCPEGSRPLEGRCVALDGGAGDGGTMGQDGCTAETWYRDDDADGYGVGDETMSACTQPEGFARQGGDCDDDDPAVHPGADERCNGIDDDCDGDIDDGLMSGEFYEDADGDGHGDPERPVAACAAPPGYVEAADDCDDNEADIYPEADERCNGIDDDCDGLADEGIQDTLGPPVAITTDSDVNEGAVSLGPLADGYVALWSRLSDHEVVAAALEPNGDIRAGPFPVAPSPSRPQRDVRAAALSDSSAVVAWRERESADSHLILAAVIDFDGEDSTEPVEVAASADNTPPSVAVVDDRIVCVWRRTSELRGRTYDLTLGDARDARNLGHYPTESFSLVAVPGAPAYAMVAMVKGDGGDPTTYVDRLQLDPLTAESSPEAIDTLDSAHTVSAATTVGPDGGPVVALTITDNVNEGAELVQIDPTDFGRPMEVLERTDLEPDASPLWAATSGAAGTIDAFVSFNDGTSRIQWAAVTLDGSVGPERTFGGSQFVGGMSATRLGPQRGALLYAATATATTMTDVWLQPIGCDEE